VDHLGGAGGGSQVGKHGDLLPLVAEEQDGAQGADPPQARLLLQQSVGVAVVLEKEPGGLKLFPRITAARATALEIKLQALPQFSQLVNQFSKKNH